MSSGVMRWLEKNRYAPSRPASSNARGRLTAAFLPNAVTIPFSRWFRRSSSKFESAISEANDATSNGSFDIQLFDHNATKATIGPADFSTPIIFLLHFLSTAVLNHESVLTLFSSPKRLCQATTPRGLAWEHQFRPQ